MRWVSSRVRREWMAWMGGGERREWRGQKEGWEGEGEGRWDAKNEGRRGW